MEESEECLKSDEIKECETNGSDKALPLSKRARKRLESKLKWESRKHEKRLKERQRKKARIAEAMKQNIKLGPTRKELQSMKMVDSKCKTSVVIDMSFNDLMSPKDMSKTINQILRTYSLNRRSSTPMQVHVTGFNGTAEQEMSKHTGYRNWDLNFHSEEYLEVFPKERIVYLTSESDNVVEALEPDKVYIIGGLVDHNSQKGLCYNLAVEKQIAHARLPIDQFVLMKTRKVLTIDQVFEILLRVAEGNSWEETLLKVLPARKGVVSVKKENNPPEEQVTNSTQESEVTAELSSVIEDKMESTEEADIPV